jgi:hypothetical protein
MKTGRGCINNKAIPQIMGLKDIANQTGGCITLNNRVKDIVQTIVTNVK